MRVLFLLMGLIFLAAGGRLGAEDLSSSGWRMWPDTNATWIKDRLYLPGEFELDGLPVNPPTGGWTALDSRQGIPVTLPATVEEYYWGKLQGKTETDGNYLGVSWWWRTFRAPRLHAGQRLVIRFRAARMRAEVYCNQKLCAYNMITEVPFEADVTSAIQPGSNLLAVRITNPGGALDWRDIDDPGLFWGTNAMPRSHAFGGLDASILLEVRDAVNVSDLAVLNRPDPFEIWVVGEVKSTGPAYNGPVSLTIKKGARQVWKGAVTVNVPSGAANSFKEVVVIPGAQRWDLDNPVLYTAGASIPHSKFSGASADFGFRWFTPEGIGTNAMFRLNGRRIVLRSAISWGYWAPNALFPDDAIAEKEVRAARELGLNCLQFHRNIGHPNVFAQQDRLGLLRYEEAGAGFNAYKDIWNSDTVIVPPTAKSMSGDGAEPENFRRKYETAKILAMVRRDRSHPSLVVYCIQNEDTPPLTNSHIFRLFRQIQAIDPSRTVYLHSGVEPMNQVAVLPYSTNFLHEDGTGHSGWCDRHTVGGPGNYQDRLYLNPTNYSHFTTNKTEIVIYGEMLGAAVPDDHEKIVKHYEARHQTGYDLPLHQKVLATYNNFLDQWGFRSSFPTASSLFSEIGKKSYFFWQKIMENSRMCDDNDFLAISGWESTAIDNHSGLVDAHRNFRTDPTLLSRAMKPEVLVVRPRRLVLQPGEQADVDVHLINETGRAGAQTLTLTAKNPDGSILFTQERPVSVTGGDVFGQLLSQNFLLIPQTNGTVLITGVLKPQGGTGSALTNTVELLVVDPLAGAPLLSKVVVVEGDGKVSQTLSNVFGITPLDASHLNDPALDAIILPGASSWLGTSIGIDDDIANTADQGLYQKQMYGKAGTLGNWGGFAPGQCTVEFHFAEQWWTNANQRVFDVAINNKTVIRALDVFKQTGGRYRALVRTVKASTADGNVKISIPNVEVDNASLAGFKITDSNGKEVSICFHSDPYTDASGHLWQTYSGTLSVEDAQWNAILDRVANDGVRLVLWPNGPGESGSYVKKLAAANLVKIASGAGHAGSLGEATAPWMGSWYFVRKHWLFDGLPTGSVLGWQYQVPQDGVNVGALLLAPAPGKPVEVVVGYGRDHEAAIGIGDCIIHHGRGMIVLPSLPSLRNALTTTNSDITQPVALRLLANAIRSQAAKGSNYGFMQKD